MRGRIFWLAMAAAVLWGGANALAAGGQGLPSITNDLGMKFVLIPAGSFTMGSPAGEKGRDVDEAAFKVTISKPYYLQTAEVTLAQWRGVMGCRIFSRRTGDFNRPVTGVSFFDVQDFIKALNRSGKVKYRLPTEAEWEYACRAGTKSPYPWGAKPMCDKAMFANNPEKADRCVDYYQPRDLPSGRPAPIKSFPANPWGLYDMAGNVWEWCQDWYGPYPKGPAIDPTGPDSGDNRVRRGGSWYGVGLRLRSSNRNFANPASRYSTTGFRLVLMP